MIRAADYNDIEILSDLMIRSIRETNHKDYSQEDLEQTYENFTPSKVEEKMSIRDMFVYEENEHIIGTVSLEGNILHSLFVMPSLQGKGIGQKLVAYVENLAGDRKLKKIRLSSSITAKLFYQHLGYAVIKFEERPFGSTWLMEKSLT